jgi:hypothetical protein
MVLYENGSGVFLDTDQEDLTVYSNIYDLKSGDVYIYSVYSRNKFTRKIKINLYAELKKGPHRISIKKLCSRAGE